MYHKKLNLYLVNQSKEVVEFATHKIYPDKLEIKVISDKQIDRKNIANADIAIIDTTGANISELLEEYNEYHSEGTLGIFCAERKKIGLIVKLFDAKKYYDIWPSLLSVEEFGYYLNTLIDNVMTNNELWLTKNYLDATINSIPDLVWYKDKVGAHLKVNKSFCKAVDKTMEQIEGRGHYYIWNITADEYAKGEFICMESEYEVMDKKETCIFDEDVLIKKELRKLKTYKSPLFDFDGTVMGTVGVAKDVTDELRYKAYVDDSTEYDALTGAHSRSYIYKYLEEKTDPVAIYYVRVDNLYTVNINSGYDAGDRVLVNTVSALNALLDGTDYTIARVGGTEFVVARYGKFLDAELKSSAEIIGDGLSSYYADELKITDIKPIVGYSKSANMQGEVENKIKEAARMVY